MVIIDVEFCGGMCGFSLIIWLVGVMVFIFLLWVKFVWVDEIVCVEGEIVLGF